MAKPKAIDLYCGVGGLSLGFQSAGFEIVGAFDNNEIAVETYNRNFHSHKATVVDLGSVSPETLLEAAEIKKRELDVLVGGPPCQGFSLIGRRAENDSRNDHILRFATYVVGLRPKYFVMENVPGLAQGKSAVLLERFEEAVAEAGYRLVKPIRVLNAADYGVPQSRKRLFVLGYRNGVKKPKYPEPPVGLFGREGYRPTVWDAIGDLPEVTQENRFFDNDRFEGELGEPSLYSERLRVNANGKALFAQESAQQPEGIGGFLRTEHSATTVERFSATAEGAVEPVSRYKRLARDGVSTTLRAGTGPDKGSYMAARPIHPVTPRCITTREAARLHSYPDWFEFHETKWHAFRQIGNSVPPLLGKTIALEVLKLSE